MSSAVDEKGPSGSRQDEVFAEANKFEFNPEDIERDRRALGHVAAVTKREHLGTATEDAIRNFAYGYGDDNPLYTEADHGRSTRWGQQVAPQIMAAVLGAPLLGDRTPKELRGGSYRGIHAFVSGGTWEWYRPIYRDDTIYTFSGLHSVEEKVSEFAGRSVLRTTQDVKINQRGEIVGVYKVLTIMTERKKSKERGKYSEIPEPSYTPEDIAELDEVYAQEQVRGAAIRYWEDVQVGDSLGKMAKGPLTTTDMVVFHAGGYGFVPYGLKTGRLGYQNRQRIPAFYIPNEYGVPDVAQRIHWDSQWAKAIGQPRAYDYGVMRECWLHHYLSDWMGDDGFVVRQYDEIRKFNYSGDIQYITGEVVGKRRENGMTLVDVTMKATNQRGDDTALGEATIALTSREYGVCLLPQPPAELQKQALDIMARHAELARAGKA